MRKPFLAALPAMLLLFAVASSSPAVAAGGAPTAPAGQPIDPDFTRGLKAIEAKDWPTAIAALKLALGRDAANPDLYNELGYAERNSGDLDAAFRDYDKALAINPKHRGAHEYVGEAYLLAGNLAKAEEHLAILNKLCLFPCEEYSDLKKKVADYKAKAK